MKIKGLWGDNLDTYHQLCDKVVIHGIRKRVVTVDIVNPFEEKESFSKGKTIDWMQVLDVMFRKILGGVGLLLLRVWQNLNDRMNEFANKDLYQKMTGDEIDAISI